MAGKFVAILLIRMPLLAYLLEIRQRIYEKKHAEIDSLGHLLGCRIDADSGACSILEIRWIDEGNPDVGILKGR